MDLWLSVFCSYTKDYSAVERWLETLTKDSLKVARRYVRAETAPDAITLGFSPQVLVAALSLKPKITVITSPEVVDGRGPAALSHKALRLFEDLIELVIAPFAPSTKVGVPEVLSTLQSTLSRLKHSHEVLDISGGTQLVPLAAFKAGFRRFTYMYPTGKGVVFHEFDL